MVEAVLDGAVTVTGSVTAPWMGACRRCLREVAGELVAEVREVFEAHPTEGETYRLQLDRLDLAPMVRDAVLLSLPLAPLCRPDCPGPDPGEHPVGAPRAASPGTRDPRWAALDGLRSGTDGNE
jgi:uncharacterized protein